MSGRGTPPPRSRGVIALLEENCTVCMVCARECPDWCITITGSTEQLPPTSPRGRPRSRHVLERFEIDYSLCLYCGICVDACPFDALFWAPSYDYPSHADEPRPLVHEREQLRSWLADVPAPTPDDGERPDPAPR